MRVRRAATSANSAATKNAFASTRSTTASRRRPIASDKDPGIDAETYRVVTRFQAPRYEALRPPFWRVGAAAPETASQVRAIPDDVRARGDEAIREHTARLDHVELP